jgi:hypothetical protein
MPTRKSSRKRVSATPVKAPASPAKKKKTAASKKKNTPSKRKAASIKKSPAPKRTRKLSEEEGETQVYSSEVMDVYTSTFDSTSEEEVRAA